MDKQKDNLYKMWRQLKLKTDAQSVEELSRVENLLAEKANKNYEDVIKAVKKIDSEQGGLCAANLWKLKKKLSPKSQDPPMAMIDEEGNLQTEATKVNEIGLQTIKKRLKNRPMKEEM